MLSKVIQVEAASHPVKSVTIYQSYMAEVTRAFTINLQSGQNAIEITGLSSSIDQGSARIHTLNESASVSTLSCDIDRSSLRALSPRALELQAMKEELAAELKIQREEYDSLNEAMRSAAQVGAELETFMEKILVRKRRATKIILEAEREIAKLEREISLLGKGRKGTASGTVSATIVAKQQCEIEIVLSYLVSGVTWTPSYDLRATTTNDGQTSPTVALHYLASIAQSTGEDWTDAALTLSTATSRTLESLSIPTNDPLKISSLATVPPPVIIQPSEPNDGRYRSRSPVYRRPYSPDYDRQRESYRRSPSRRPRSRSPVYRDRRPRSRSTHVERTRAPSKAAVAAQDVQVAAAVNRTPLSLSYQVNGTVSLPSNGLAHKISIAVLEFTAELRYVCVPRKEASVFVEASIKNTSEYQLLPGSVSVFVDNGFVTKTYLQLVNVGESFGCVLGVDTALKVSFAQQSRTEQDVVRNFVEPSKTITRTLTTTVTNGHSVGIAGLIVCDAIPLGDENANMKVTLNKPEGLATAKEDEVVSVSNNDQEEIKVRWTTLKEGRGGEKDGLYEWVCGIPAGEQVTLETEWSVRGPAQTEWEEFS